MRTASTTARTEDIILSSTASHHRSALKLEIDNNGEWDVINDMHGTRGVDWTESGKKEKYANVALTPLPGTIAFNIENKNGKYSDGSGTSFEGVIDKETKVRLQSGPILDTLGASTEEAFELNDVSGLFIGTYLYHAEYSGSYINVTPTWGLGLPPHFSDMFYLYDSLNYDEATYSLDSYAIHTYDAAGKGWQQNNSIKIDNNNTSGKIYYRLLNDPGLVGTSILSDWTLLGSTIDGEQTLTLSTTARFIQIAVTYDGITWSDDFRTNSITAVYQSYVEWIYKSVYYLDRPKYNDPKSPQMPMITCAGRDAYKRAIITDVNIENELTTSGDIEIDFFIKKICDQIKLKYSATSIADLSAFTVRTYPGLGKVEKADKIFEYCMNILNTVGYRMYMQYDDTLEDDILYIQPSPSTADASGAFNYKNYESIGDISKNSDRIMQRMTILSTDESIEDEGLLDTQAISTTGNKLFTWDFTSREFKRIVVDKPDDITISNLVVGNLGLFFNVDSVIGTVNVTIYGSAWSGDTPLVEGEAIDWDNHIAGVGTTSKIINPLVPTIQDAHDISLSYITNYGNPSIEARSLRWPYLNLMPEINDLFMMWRRFIFTNDVFFIVKISHHWDSAGNPKEWTIYNLDDTGLDRDDPEWDDGTSQWDKGWVWDMGISTPLNTQAEIDAISDALAVHNVAFS